MVKIVLKSLAIYHLHKLSPVLVLEIVVSSTIV